jgi:hypothetical protein
MKASIALPHHLESSADNRLPDEPADEHLEQEQLLQQ